MTDLTITAAKHTRRCDDRSWYTLTSCLHHQLLNRIDSVLIPNSEYLALEFCPVFFSLQKLPNFTLKVRSVVLSRFYWRRGVKTSSYLWIFCWSCDVILYKLTRNLSSQQILVSQFARVQCFLSPQAHDIMMQYFTCSKFLTRFSIKFSRH